MLLAVVGNTAYVPYIAPRDSATCFTPRMSIFRHIMLMKFRPEATSDQIEAALAGLATMPVKVPGILRYEFGLDLGLGDSNPDLALVADFASEEDWHFYTNHPDHVAMIESRISPIKESVIRSQYLIED